MKNSVISDSEINYIVDIILSEEGLKDNKDFSLFITDRGNYYKNLFKGNMNSFSDVLLLPFVANGVNNSGNDILLFLDNIIKDCDKELAIYRLVEVIYHEIGHIKQLSFDKYSYNNLFVEVDKYLRIYNNYYLNHDSYYFEIDASLYSLNKTKYFLEKYYSNVYDKYENNINKRIDGYNNDIFLYDSVDKLSEFIGLYRYNKYHFKKDKNLDEISSIFDIFLDEKMNYKNISNIINDVRFKNLDKRIIYSFFSVDSFLCSFDYSSLSKDELDIIIESLMFTKKMYEEQLIEINKNFNNKMDKAVNYLKKHKSLLKRIDYICYFIKNNIFSDIYFVNNSINKKILIKRIEKVIIDI